MPAVFPIGLIVEGKRCVVVGGGEIAAQKVNSLLVCGADVMVVSPQPGNRITEWVKAGVIGFVSRTYQSGDLEGAFLAVAATDDESVNLAVAQDARQRGMLLNVVDRPELCDFYYPAVLRRGDLTISISTDGQSPALARALRDWLETEFDESYEKLLEVLAEFRDPIRERFQGMSDRRQVWDRIHSQREKILECLRQGERERAREVVRSCIS